MPQRGPKPKPDDRRQRRNQPGQAVTTPAAAVVVPMPPPGLMPSTRSRWVEFWNSDLARLVRPGQRQIVERLFQRYDERDRAYRAVKMKPEYGGGRVTYGSQGQLVAHPLLKYIDSCDAEIRQLEDRLGMNPRSFAALGLTFASAQKTLDDLNASMEDEDQDDSDSDPRRVAIVE